MAEAVDTSAPIAKPTSSPSYLQNMDELQKVFEKFDSNGDGKISLSELADVLRSMGTNYSPPDLQRVMEDIDADKDGFIDLEEFAQLCRSSSASAEELREAFDLYDENKDGRISGSELHQVLNRLGMKCSMEECSRMIKGVDSDGDGCVNFQEFEKMMATANGSAAAN
ncbi:unnamed protein product [Linum tenue]|uniref:EF-hand domain-containing protein n=4 Tax=Linum tenue TaxID=586396 RepID=A0AAV0LRE5_9ROSI|nr:unnamed protein product [Linum tenue]